MLLLFVLLFVLLFALLATASPWTLLRSPREARLSSRAPFPSVALLTMLHGLCLLLALSAAVAAVAALPRRFAWRWLGGSRLPSAPCVCSSLLRVRFSRVSSRTILTSCAKVE